MPKRLDFLDGLRGMAILLVILAHTSRNFFSSIEAPSVFVLSVLGSFRNGVLLFFVVSAFTLYHATSKWREAGDTSWLNFYIRRIFRIFPLWIPFVFVYYSITPDATPLDLWANLTFLFGIIKLWPVANIVPGGWSIFVEETFYWLFPFMFRHGQKLRNCLVFTGVFLLSAFFISTWVIPSVADKDVRNFLYYSWFQYYFCFGLGFVSYHLYKSGFAESVVSTKTRRMTASLICLVWVYGLGFLSKEWGSVGYVLLLICAFNEETFWGKLARFRPLVLSGKYCYSMYITHSLIIKLLGINTIFMIQKWSHLWVGYAIYSLLIIAVTFAVSAAIYHAYELPFIKLGGRIVKRRLERVAVAV